MRSRAVAGSVVRPMSAGVVLGVVGFFAGGRCMSCGRAAGRGWGQLLGCGLLGAGCRWCVGWSYSYIGSYCWLRFCCGLLRILRNFSRFILVVLLCHPGSVLGKRTEFRFPQNCSFVGRSGTRVCNFFYYKKTQHQCFFKIVCTF